MSWIEDRFFTRKTGKTYEIIGTISTGFKSHDAVDIIKSLDTGKVKYIRRINLFAMISGEGNVRYLNDDEIHDVLNPKDQFY